MSFLVFAAFAVFLIFWWRHVRYRMRENAWRPPALKNAKPIYAEQVFFTLTPFPLVAKVDRGYLLGNRIVLVELKTRKVAAVYQSDVIELSAQRVAVEAVTGLRVANAGYVVIQHADNHDRTTLEVPLFSGTQVTSLARSLEDLRARRVLPTKIDRPRLCVRCAFIDECRPD